MGVKPSGEIHLLSSGYFASRIKLVSPYSECITVAFTGLFTDSYTAPDSPTHNIEKGGL